MNRTQISLALLAALLVIGCSSTKTDAAKPGEEGTQPSTSSKVGQSDSVTDKTGESNTEKVKDPSVTTERPCREGQSDTCHHSRFVEKRCLRLLRPREHQDREAPDDRWPTANAS